jgi:hypothetical protein
MQDKDKADLMKRTAETQPSALDVKGYDGKVDKEREAAKHNDGKAHLKSCFK